jgi:polyhydroxyalkanoate synthesis repressor PhaR
MNKIEKQKIIKRYKNRKLYDTSCSCYITLHDIGCMVKEGQDVLVVDSQTGKDLTQVILAQVLLGEEKKVARMPRAVFQEIMQSGGEVLRDFYKKRVTSNREIRLFFEWAREIKNLHHTVAQLENRVSELEAWHKKEQVQVRGETPNG